VIVEAPDSVIVEATDSVFAEVLALGRFSGLSPPEAGL